LSALNDCLYDDLTRSELFITMFYLNFDSDRKRLSFSNAGHNPPVVWRSNSQTCEWLDAEGLILGVKRDVHFEEKQVQLRTGDILVLYTDGITEAANPDELLFGESRLCALLEEFHALSPQQIVENVLEQVRCFTGTQSLVDDVSLVVMKLENGHGESC
jgi:serine phosphatase RsbU (regulator of sigma subunit)